MGVHQIWAARKDGTIGSFILFYVNWKRKGHATAFGHSRSFNAALIGGKMDFPVFLRSERRKTGNCSFTAVPIDGKVDFPVFLLSEGRKTANRMWWKYFDPIFILFSPLLLVGGSWVGA
ncbi:hypothetical protein AAC387_Pa02g3940 [Persea americana]